MQNTKPALEPFSADPTAPPPYTSTSPPAPLQKPGLPGSAPGKPKRRFPMWLLLLGFVCFWLSGLATIGVFFLTGREEEKQKEIIRGVQGELWQEGTASVGMGGLQNPTPLPNIYSNGQIGYEIGYPAGWKRTELNETVYLFDGIAQQHDLPRPYRFGRIIVKNEETTNLDVAAWFEEKFAGQENAPEKRKLLTNKNGVVLLETVAPDREGRLRYYFVANGMVVSLSMNVTQLEATNSTLQKVYGAAVDSVKIGRPS
ncbi:MAG: hypothetical protein N2691_04320 [Patescibacteria group bacterium]|nr:hypothetical protein [Patescibacteria group bacterium]